jgi:hypothetical protein
MSVLSNTYIIPNLGSTATFYDWFNKENNEVIAKLNLLKVYGATSGDGVLVTPNTNGTYQFSIGGTSGIIQSNLTFSGNVTFNGNLNVPNNIIQISGITSGSSGYTFATPIRVFLSGSTPGYTAARANSQDNAEVLGYIVSRGTTFSNIAIDGRINGDFSSIYGKGLSAGVVYFLDPNTAGRITDIEPVTTGSVSKPVFMGLSGDSAVVLTYRGNYLNADLTSYGSSGSNQIAFSLDNVTYPTADAQILLGDVLSYSPSYATTVSSNGNRVNYGGWFHSKDNVLENKYIIGVVIDKYTAGGNLIVTLQLSGYTNVYSTQGNGSLYLTSSFDLSDRANNPQLLVTEDSVGNSTLIATVYDDASNSAIINITPGTVGQVQTSTSAAASASSSSSENLLMNGNFEVWQRSENGKNTSYTATGNAAFADLWRRRDGITGGTATKNYYIVRRTFSDYQTDIQGSPHFYVDIKALGLSANNYPGISGGQYPGYTACDHLLVGHTVPDAKTFDDKEVSISFYAKTSHANYNEVLVYLARYAGGTLLDYKVLGSAALTTNWAKYDFVSVINSLPSSATPLLNDYCEIGLDLIPLVTQAKQASVPLVTNVFVSLASFNAGYGGGVIGNHSFKTYNEQLRYCQQFYYSTYAKDERIGTATMTSAVDPSTTTPYMVTIPAYASVVHELPSYMRTAPNVTVYSPYSGTTNEAYNFSAQRELRYTSGTSGFGGAIRSAPTGASVLSLVSTPNSVRLNVLNGQVPYDQIHYHFIADADFSI